jgi:amino acid transporter
VKKLSRDTMALLVALVVCVLVIILLTPIGFETRPQSDLKTLGYIAIGTIFTGLTLFLLSIVFLFRRVRLASKLAIIASILFFVPVIGDRAGAFFSVPIPPAINILEYIHVIVLLATLFLASRVYMKSNSASKQPMDSGTPTSQK